MDERLKKANLEIVISQLVEALIWVSGLPDFNEGGQAREGWLKLGRPALEAGLDITSLFAVKEVEDGENA